MAYTDRDTTNYLGMLYQMEYKKTPFLSMIGGLNTGKTVTSMRFPLSQPWTTGAAAQTTVSEDTACAEGTADTTTRSQVYNVCQYVKHDREVSVLKEATTGEFAGIQIIGNQPVTSELSFQKAAGLAQVAKDMDYSFIKGTFVDVGTSATNTTTRGMEEAISTNTVAAGTTDLSKAHIDNLLRTMLGNGSPFTNPVIFVNAFQMDQISDIYGFAPTDRYVGGVAIRTIITPHAGEIGVVYDPNVTTSKLLLIDVAYCSPVFLPTKGKLIRWEDKPEVAEKTGGWWAGVYGLDYGHEKLHGSITGLTTS